MDAIEDQLIRADLVVTTGGVSVGAYDVVKEVLSRLGTVAFEQVAMQPGKPQGFGTIGPDSTPIFTLPGNPVSSYVSFEVFVRPVIRRMLGVEPLDRPMVRAVCKEAMTSPDGQAAVRPRVDRRRGGPVRREAGRRRGLAPGGRPGPGQRASSSSPRTSPRSRGRRCGRRHGARATPVMSRAASPTSTSRARPAWSTCPARRSPRARATATGRVLVSAEVVRLLRGRRGAQG